MKIHEFRLMYIESDTKLRTMLTRKETTATDERQSVLDAPNFYSMSMGEHDAGTASIYDKQHWKWKCKQCPWGFETRQELQQHDRIHRLGAPININLENSTAAAGVASTAPDSSNSVERNHSDDDGDYATIVNVDPSVLADIIGDDKMNMTRWNCKQCPRSFQKRSDLREHNRIHVPTKVQQTQSQPHQSQQPVNAEQPLMELQPDVELEPAEAMLLLSSLGAASVEHGKSDTNAGVGGSGSGVAQSDMQRWKCKQCMNVFLKRDFLRAHKREYPKGSCKLSAAVDASQLHSNKQPPFKIPGVSYRIDGRYGDIAQDTQRRFKSGGKTEGADNRWECTLCEKMCTTRKELRDHRRNDHKKEDRLRMAATKAKQLPRGEKRWVCRYCGQSFLTRTILRTHLRTHSGNEQSVAGNVSGNNLSMIYSAVETICTYCGQRYASKEQLQEHMRQHAQQQGDAKTYLCVICNQLFVDKYHLSSHIDQHPAIPPPYTCKRCRKTFLDSTILKEHVKSEHLTARKYVCNICTKDFSRNGSLKSHIMTHRDEERHFYIQRQAQMHQQQQQHQHQQQQQHQQQHQQSMSGFVPMPSHAQQ